MPLQFRRGTDAQRTAATPAAGEPVWVTDTQKLYVGDGSTAGGIEIAGGGGTAGGAPTNASYLVLATNTNLSAERALVISTGLQSTDGGANGNLTLAIATHAASFLGSGTVALARGGLAADISTTGGSRNFLKQTGAGSVVSVSALAATELGTSGSPGTDTYLRGDLTWQTVAGGGGGGAPTDASYIVLTTNTNLSQERSLVISTGLSSTDAGADGNLTIALATHAASFIGSGTVALARGGLAADISTTGGSRHFLKQTGAGSVVSVSVLAATELGTSGTPGTDTFLRGDLTWQTTGGGGGGGGTKTYGAFTPLDNQPQTSAFATLDTRDSGVAVLDFDAAALEAATFLGVLPEAAVTTNGLKIRIAWTADTVTNTDAVVWGIQFQRVDTTTDLDTDAFSNTVTATAAASGTAGVPVITEITVTGTAALDSIVAGDFYRIRISRDGTAASDALTADACLVGVEIRDAT